MLIRVFLKLWHCQIIWYLFAGFKVIILLSVHFIWFVKYVFSAKLRFVKTSTRLVKYKSRVVESNPAHFVPCPPKKISNYLLICVNLYQHAKNQSNSICTFLRYTVNLDSRDQIGHIHTLIMSNQKLLEKLSVFVNLYQPVSLVCSREIVDLKTLIGWQHFGLYLTNMILRKYRIYAGTQQI